MQYNAMQYNRTIGSTLINFHLTWNMYGILIWVATQRKDPYIGKMKIEFCIACSREYSAGHFGTKIMYLAQFLTELLRILSFKTCIMKN